MNISKYLRTTVLAAAVSGVGCMAFADDVEVLHWWTAGGEAAALGVLKKSFRRGRDLTCKNRFIALFRMARDHHG